MKIAILGAECTGKSTLAQALLAELQTDHPTVTWVPEFLGEWCDTQARRPGAHEQAHIAAEQMARVHAHQRASMVLSDTTPLMTAVYSDLLFGDPSLYAQAVEQHRNFDLTLVTGLDLPWLADGIRRDGPDTRTQVDHRLREVLQRHGISYSTVHGQAQARTRSALQAIAYAIGAPRPRTVRSTWIWPCEKCSDSECEHRLFRGLLPSV
jgi:HTH-type transcriptional repressor of NAD biosynthesis genes